MVKRMLPDPFGWIVVSAICPFEASSGSWLGKLRDLDMQNKTKSLSYIQCGLLELCLEGDFQVIEHICHPGAGQRAEHHRLHTGELLAIGAIIESLL